MSGADVVKRRRRGVDDPPTIGARARGIALALVLVAIAAAGAWVGAADLLGLHANVLAGAPSILIAHKAAAVVLMCVALVVIASMELIRPGLKGQNRLFGTGLVFFCAGLVALPVFPLIIGEVLPTYGYQRCPGRVVGYTLPASRWARSPTACARAVAR